MATGGGGGGGSVRRLTHHFGVVFKLEVAAREKKFILQVRRPAVSNVAEEVTVAARQGGLNVNRVVLVGFEDFQKVVAAGGLLFDKELLKVNDKAVPSWRENQRQAVDTRLIVTRKPGTPH